LVTAGAATAAIVGRLEPRLTADVVWRA